MCIAPQDFAEVEKRTEIDNLLFSSGPPYFLIFRRLWGQRRIKQLWVFFTAIGQCHDFERLWGIVKCIKNTSKFTFCILKKSQKYTQQICKMLAKKILILCNLLLALRENIKAYFWQQTNYFFLIRDNLQNGKAIKTNFLVFALHRYFM